jgi:protein-S-isoprenylcysteine O-methyltransferase Ste14
MADASSPIDDIKVKITKVVDQQTLNSILGNTLNGEIGTRGEAYVAAQAFLVLCILFGGLPILGDFLSLLCGPLLMIAGVVAVVVGVVDMGSSLSPWPVPTGDELITDGIFSLMRHPIYAGLLGIMAGFSVSTGSAPRLLLTAALWYVLDLKSEYEEKQLVKEYSEYKTYKENVPGKFFPADFLAILPWTNRDDSDGSFQ